MSPQHSNRARLIEGTLRCLESLPSEKITARAIAEESGANIASITYHFGSKDDLVTLAAIEGLDRWLDEVAEALSGVNSRDPAMRFRRAAEAMEAGREGRTGLATNFVVSLAKAQHDPRLREKLADGFRRTRPAIAALLDLGDDQEGQDAAGVVLSLFHGLLIQVLLDPGLAIDGDRLHRAQSRLYGTLFNPAPPGEATGHPRGRSGS